jgi:hypothetical protein
MSRTIIRLAIPLFGGALVSLSLFSCSSDKSSPNTGTHDAGSGGKTGSGGSSSGGKTGSGGGTSSGGAATTDAGGLYKCKVKEPGTAPDGGLLDPGGTLAAGAGCCGVYGVCTAKADLSSDPAAASYGHSDCKASSNLFCAPKPSSQIPDGGVTPPCHIAFGTLNLEGRCLPKCFTLSNSNASQLNPGDCPTLAGVDLVCAPCYDPVSGTKTGACERNGDAPVDGKKQFAECGAFPADGGGAKQGLCVPAALVAQTGADPTLVPQDTCGRGELCAPKNKVTNQGSCFQHCSSTLGGPGACVPTYIVEFGAGKGLSGTLGKVTCLDGETCTPCISPLNTMPTGACTN